MTPPHGGNARAAESHGDKYAEPIPSTRHLHSVDDSRPLPTESVSIAMQLAGAVHDEGPADVAAILNPLDRSELLALAVTLAAMVPVDYSPVELLAWNDARWMHRPAPVTDHQPPLFPAVLVNRRPLQPHGTHAAFVRHRANREDPCDACVLGEREYQRNRKRISRASARPSDHHDTTAEEAST